MRVAAVSAVHGARRVLSPVLPSERGPSDVSTSCAHACPMRARVRLLLDPLDAVAGAAVACVDVAQRQPRIVRRRNGVAAEMSRFPEVMLGNVTSDQNRSERPPRKPPPSPPSLRSTSPLMSLSYDVTSPPTSIVPLS